ncbi:DUF3040 domain-containing protein [Dactylosporangium aurantiacum]|uniref:DUF3040 domain-containing protein n=1 Tax=Dactylosporangium aurantiacum TaxID=35754 RepID=A0A9Q9IM02_9ACTN|nr:DUF3040 domain-containing protein [Dactylosporangium aurantiacum]MDG6110396.1 DUF3040 domain-containing protein [Dactylosporangium aurantiacum]UWZ58607.1 DUF3040 domain-containing protein [Dactylosporangium aurantiacum]
MSGGSPPDDRERLAQIEWSLRNDDPEFVEAFSQLRPRAPRECRRRQMRQRVTAAGLVIALVLTLWTVLGWVVAALLTLKIVAAVVLLSGDFEIDADGASI